MPSLGDVLLVVAFISGLTTVQLLVRWNRALPHLQQQTSHLRLNPANLPLSVTVGTYLRILRKSLPFPLGGCPPLRVNVDRRGYDLPTLEVIAPLRVTRAHLEDYYRAVNSTLSSTNSEGDGRVPTFFLAAVSSSLFVLLASHAKCPIAMVGAINTTNVFEMLDTKVLESFEGFAAKEWEVVGRMGGVAERKKRGVEWTMTVEVGEKGGKPIFRATFKVRLRFSCFRAVGDLVQALKFLPKGKEPKYEAAKESDGKRTTVDDLPKSGLQLRPTAQSTRLYVRLLATDGQWYDSLQARSSQDYNPIHLSSLAARLLGLPSAIAHGNLVVVAAAHALETQKSDAALVKLWRGKAAWRTEVAFRSIMQVGKTFDLRIGDEGYIVAKGEKVCIDATAGRL